MKILLFCKFSILFISVLLPQSAFAQDYIRWGLPEGATARLGKGSISDIAYSPDGARLAVAGSVGIWLYDARTGAEIALITEHTHYLTSIAFSPDGGTLVRAGVGRTIPSACGHAVTGSLQSMADAQRASACGMVTGALKQSKGIRRSLLQIARSGSVDYTIQSKMMAGRFSQREVLGQYHPPVGCGHRRAGADSQRAYVFGR